MVLMTTKNIGSLVLLLVLISKSVVLVDSIICSCQRTPAAETDSGDCNGRDRATCGPANTVGCFQSRTVHTIGDEDVEILRLGCVFFESVCTRDVNPDTESIACCFDGDRCNANLTLPFLLPTTVATTVPSEITTPSSDSLTDPNTLYKEVVIAVPVVSAFLIVLIIAGMVTLLYLLRRRKMRIEQLRSEEHRTSGIIEPFPIYSPYSLDTIDLEDMSCTSGSGSGEPLLTQRTIARSIKLGEPVGSGRFGQVFVGEFQGDRVAVKKFASRDEQSWFRESEIYNTVLLRHDNILGFVACDVFSNNGVTELWLITQYYPHGSLFDYLNRYSVSPKIMMRMVISICKGLAHLHTEFSAASDKPAIAHRDIKSKNILVKNTRECCIADFGLAVMKRASSKLNLPANPKQGTKRYMAPEILDETIDLSDFDSFKRADVYAFGLVLWEICKRCGDKNDSVGDYEPPFHGMVGQDPSFEEMRKIVVVDRMSPAIPEHWRNNDLLQGMSSVMKECWYFESEARNNMLFHRNRLMRLANEDKIEYDVQE